MAESGLNGRFYVESADQRIAFSVLAPVKQEEFQPFSPDLNPRRGKFCLNYRSVCFLPEALPPPDWVKAVALTVDGRRALSGARDNTMRLWDVESGQLLQTLKGHTSEVFAVALIADGRRALSGSFDSTLRLWDLESCQLLQTLKGHTSGVIAVALTPDGRRALSASADRTLRLWDLG